MDIQGAVAVSKIPHVFNHFYVTVVTVAYIGWAVDENKTSD